MQSYFLRNPSEDILIALPDPNIDAFLKESPGLTIEMATQDDFHLLRIIANLGFTDREGHTYFVFRPPARLQVRFTPADLNRAQRRGKPLALGYWVEDHWERFPPGNVPADPETSGDGWAYFLIRAIGDPPIAWGT